MGTKTFEDFINFRDDKIYTLLGSIGKNSIFIEDVAKQIYQMEPKTLEELSTVRGFRAGSQQLTLCGRLIIEWF